MNLKTAFEPYFKIGAAISNYNLHVPAHMKLLTSQFKARALTYPIREKKNSSHSLHPAMNGNLRALI